jgi:hypothetical protein
LWAILGGPRVKRRAVQEKGGILSAVKDGDRNLVGGDKGCFLFEKHIEQKMELKTL